MGNNHIKYYYKAIIHKKKKKKKKRKARALLFISFEREGLSSWVARSIDDLNTLFETHMIIY
jgi:hypothetical protein